MANRAPALVTAALSLLTVGCGLGQTSEGAGLPPGPPTVLVDTFTPPSDISEPPDTVGEDAVLPQCVDDRGPGLAFSTGPFGVHRNKIAGDFAVTTPSGLGWSLADHFNGCESVVVLTDAVPISALDRRSIWDDDGALARLVDRSPANVHYLFVSNDPDAAAGAARITAMDAQVTALLGTLEPSRADHWTDHLHVVTTRAQELEGWLGAALTSTFSGGLAIGRDQRIHGVGSLADVTRYDQALADADAWPWESDLAYAAHEATYLDADHALSAALAADTDLTVTLFDGEVLAQQAAVDVPLPAGLDGYDTLQVEVTMACPDPDAPELASCGPWDYIARLYVTDPDAPGGATEVEIARFITSYGRETHWIVDASLALPLLRAGGTRHFRWDFAPEWNTQPTATHIRLAFGDRQRGIHPTRTVPLFSGGAFGPAYNEREPVVVPIPATAHHVELWVLVTGHGAGTAQCAEFCPHQHVFTVDGHLHLEVFREAGDEDGCVAAIARGMVPNQGGTWWFGRGGWCPGAPVTPWVVDVSSEVTPGSAATITYKGQLAGTTPPEGAGEIVLSSYLVIWE